ncbi:MAG TPA: hypothetical protein VJZ26_05900 [Blastocatellia bacterium]|nr:hypothetical protein [Blastocatellia bacterium]
MADKSHWKLYLDSEIVNRYEQAADQFGKRSGNEIAAEVLNKYLDFWIEGEMARAQVFEQQREQLRVSGAYSRGRGGEARKAQADALSREKKKRIR